jgi:ATP-dependent Clp protease ATP-binding subunit ClpB
MNFNQFTIKAQEVVQEAIQQATQGGMQSIEAGHLLKAILLKDKNVTPFLLKKTQANQFMIEKALDKIISTYPKVSGGQPYLSQASNQIVSNAVTSLKKLMMNM